MNATKYAVAAAEHEVADAYRDLDRMLSSGRKVEALKQAVRLVKQDPVRLWNYLREYTSTNISFLETTPLLVVSALSNSWAQDHQDVFVVRAVLALLPATKGNTAADEMMKYL